MGLRHKILSAEQTTALFAQVEDSRFLLLAALCRFPSAVQELKEMHARADYSKAVLTFRKAPDESDETPPPDNDEDSDDVTSEPNQQPAAIDPASNAGTDTDLRRSQILAAAERLEPLLRAYDPLKDTGGKRGKLVQDAMQELTGLLRLQPPRDSCLHILSEAAKRDRDDKEKKYRENLYKDPYAFMREHERAMIRAKELLRTHNMRLALKIAHKHKGRGIDFETLLTEGALGLWRAIESYEPAYGYAFSTYAVNWIKQRMDRCIQNESRMMRLPVHAAQMHGKLLGIKKNFHLQHNRDPSIEELANLAKTTAKIAKRLTDPSTAHPHSLSTPLSDGDDRSGTFGDFICDERADTDIVEFTNRIQLRANLTQAMLATLTPKEEFVLRLRMGIAPNAEHTLEEVGARFDVTRERIRQIEAQALRKLRGRKHLKALAHYNL